MWDTELDWAIRLCHGKFSKITFAAAVYQVWIERNARMFTSDVRGVLAVTETNGSSRVISRMKFPKNQENIGLC